jgi:hypothetical protein
MRTSTLCQFCIPFYAKRASKSILTTPVAAPDFLPALLFFPSLLGIGRRFYAAVANFSALSPWDKKEEKQEMSQEIARNYVGKINVVGDALVYGLALRPGTARQVVYLDMVGPRSSVDAVWARLSRKSGSIAWLRLDSGGMVGMEYSPGLKRYQVSLETIAQDNMVAVVEEESDEQYSYILSAEGKPARDALLAALKGIWNGPLYLEWADALLTVGRAQMLAYDCVSYGGVGLIALDKKAEKWEKAIVAAMKDGSLTLPEVAE